MIASVIWELQHIGVTMICKIIDKSYGNPLKSYKILLSNVIIHSQEKFVVRLPF